MKKYYYLLLAASAVLFFAACEKNDDPIDKVPEEKIENALLILNQGTMDGNNATLAKYDLEEEALSDNFFLENNERNLGDTANDMIRYGEKIYIVVNGSSTVEVISAKNGKSLKKIDFKNNEGLPKQPRTIIGYDKKVYVSSFDNTVTRIDTSSLAIDGSVIVGRNPEGICAANNKLYVANSGGLDFEGGNFDSTVSVIDIDSFTETEKIEVGKNPFQVFPDHAGNIYVSIRAVWNGWDMVSPAMLKKINTADNNKVDVIENIVPAEFTIVDNKAYIIIDDYTQSKVTVYDCANNRVVQENLISEPELFTTPFSIAVDRSSGNIFITQTDYQTPGKVHCLDKTGKLRYTVSDTGINPYRIIQL